MKHLFNTTTKSWTTKRCTTQCCLVNESLLLLQEPQTLTSHSCMHIGTLGNLAIAQSPKTTLMWSLYTCKRHWQPLTLPGHLEKLWQKHQACRSKTLAGGYRSKIMLNRYSGSSIFLELPVPMLNSISSPYILPFSINFKKESRWIESSKSQIDQLYHTG
jgi:hypothetical protein